MCSKSRPLETASLVSAVFLSRALKKPYTWLDIAGRISRGLRSVFCGFIATSSTTRGLYLSESTHVPPQTRPKHAERVRPSGSGPGEKEKASCTYIVTCRHDRYCTAVERAGGRQVAFFFFLSSTFHSFHLISFHYQHYHRPHRHGGKGSSAEREVPLIYNNGNGAKKRIDVHTYIERATRMVWD